MTGYIVLPTNYVTFTAMTGYVRIASSTRKTVAIAILMFSQHRFIDFHITVFHGGTFPDSALRCSDSIRNSLLCQEIFFFKLTLSLPGIKFIILFFFVIIIIHNVHQYLDGDYCVTNDFPCKKQSREVVVSLVFAFICL